MAKRKRSKLKRKLKCNLCRSLSSCDTQDESGFWCTRAKNHKGNHAACGITNESHPIKEWTNEKETK